VVIVSGPLASPAQAAGPQFLGSLLSSVESRTLSWGRDGGYSVPLPNGKVFWIFGDTPRYEYKDGRNGKMWYMTYFITGNTAGMMSYQAGRPPGRFNELRRDAKDPDSPRNQPGRFMSVPKLYKADGSDCKKTGPYDSTEAARWPQGALLMPDKANILITYVGACADARGFDVQSYGFAIYNWKTNKFTVKPNDVFPAHPLEHLPRVRYFGSPIIVGKRLTLYSWADGHIYAATMAATTTAMKNPASYDPEIIEDLPGNVPFSVSPASSTQPHLTMYQLTDRKGGYQILSSAAQKPLGPWTAIGRGVLPKCDTSSSICFAVSLHPELSPKHKILATYYLPDWGTFEPGQHANPLFGHTVMANLPD